ncbi:trypsin-like serine protease [Streptacidiphilus sp. PB12-B1b]|uniref:trypsin-like serine peptidase n=1 Tax=Streptacidiphilus sp. PB12-B1b TaxID=2705012 RepID=UPI0015FAEDC6|nr:trypsin-like serine protease [Streptacidiphilus sp. PB12-B1b]QMU77503.1 trypsin-like serine protease [Streptacidiphilus sp. PB12-B1b]
MEPTEPESRPQHQRATPRNRRRTAAIALTTGLVLAVGVLATTSSSADTRLLHILDVAKAQPMAAPNTPAPAAPRSATAAPRPSASASATTSRAARAAAVTPAPKASADAAPSRSAAPAQAPPTTEPGRSLVLTKDQQPSQVGALFSSSGLSGSHHCTASVVDSPGGDIIVTAAHCLTTGTTTGDVFVPGYRDGSAPFGVWQISSVVEASAWTDDGDVDDDVAFAVVKPLNGRTVESVVGSYTLGTGGASDDTVQLTGYPEATDEPITCTGSSSAFTATQLQIYCTDYTDGTSGSGWIADYDPDTGSGTLIGVIGGYETGGDTPDVSYSPLFGSDVKALYDQALTLA